MLDSADMKQCVRGRSSLSNIRAEELPTARKIKLVKATCLMLCPSIAAGNVLTRYLPSCCDTIAYARSKVAVSTLFQSIPYSVISHGVTALLMADIVE